MIAVLDTGALSSLVPTTERQRARLRALRNRVDDLELPAAVLAESVFTGHPGHDHHMRRLLATLDVVVIDRELGEAAGRLRRGVSGTDPLPSGVDACVAAVADELARRDEVTVITVDVDDLEVLAAGTANAARIRVLRP